MTTMNHTGDHDLTCDRLDELLPDYLEGTLPTAERAGVEAHAAGCTRCASLLNDLQDVRAAAAALPTLRPSRDLWEGIAARIEAPVIELDAAARRAAVGGRRPRRDFRLAWMGAAAAALVAVTAGITYSVTRAQYRETAVATTTAPSAPSVARESLTTTAPQVAVVSTPPVPQSPDANGSASTTGQPGAQRSAGSTPAAVASTRRATAESTAPTGARLARAEGVMNEMQPVYDREISKLRTIVKSRHSQLDPRTIAVLEQSIAVIDSAIAQSRAALAKDPASGFLAEQLNHSLEKKVELLRTAAMLPART
jgi:anti-sigma factor RsiW